MASQSSAAAYIGGREDSPMVDALPPPPPPPQDSLPLHRHPLQFQPHPSAAMPSSSAPASVPEPAIQANNNHATETATSIVPGIRRVDSDGNTISSGGDEYHETETHDGEWGHVNDNLPSIQDEDANSEGEDSDSATGDHEGREFYWISLREDNSAPTPLELATMESRGEKSALDEKHWRQATFEDFGDEEISVLGEGVIHWTVPNFRGTRENPNKDFIRYSPTIKVAGLHWRLKLYPRGNETEYLAVYLECQSLLSDLETPHAFEDGGDRYFFNEPVAAVLPSTRNDRQQKRRRYPVQLGILMYNPKEPRTNFFKTKARGVLAESPDAGHTMFGETGGIYVLGSRLPHHRTPMLQDDQLAFTAYFRILEDPTSQMFDGCGTKSGLRPFDVLGIHGFNLCSKYESIERCRNLTIALTTWLLLSPIRAILYKIKSPFEARKHVKTNEAPLLPAKPLINALQKMLLSTRTPGAEHSFPSQEVLSAIGRHGIRFGLHLDVVRLWQILADVIEHELRDTSVSFKNSFGTHRCKLLPDKLTSVRHGIKQLVERGKYPVDSFPDILMVELPRWNFDTTRREWTRSKEPVKIEDVLRIQKEKESHYQLYAVICDATREGAGKAYHAYLRPDGKNWIRTPVEGESSTLTTLRRVTAKSVELAANKDAYLLLYVKLDLASKNMNVSSRMFEGHPESSWSSPPEWQSKVNAQWEMDTTGLSSTKQPSQEVVVANEDTEMADADMADVQRLVNISVLDKFTTCLVPLGDVPISVNKPLIPQFKTLLQHHGLANSGASDTRFDIWKVDASEYLHARDSTKDKAIEDLIMEHHDLHGAYLHHIRLIVEPILSDHDLQRLRSNGKLTNMVHCFEYLHHSKLNPTDAWTRTGQSVEDYHADEYYRGSLSCGRPHGQGYYIYDNGDVYDGQFRMGDRHGRGIQTFQNGDIYDGQWVDGEMHGQGTLIRATTGNTYTGEFRNGKQHAPGITQWRVPASHSRICQICFEAEQNAVFLDCGHVCACIDCSKRSHTCPVCRRQVSRTVRLYFLTD